MVTDVSRDKTEVGNYFIANYPPFSFWKKEHLGAIEAALAGPASSEAPLGLYLHIPFCRKRCKFCYFRVYTDVNADAIQDYVDALLREVSLVAREPAVQGRAIDFVYFGGGTPSYLSVRQLDGLAERLRQHLPWERAREITFECEPGTLSEPKLRAIHGLGVTRLSLGVENFSDSVLEENGRAHLSAEIERAWEWIRAIGFRQVNVDLIAGMIGETEENWRRNIERTLELSPESVTIYQMELPYNTRYSKDLAVLEGPREPATWSTKRRWVSEAFDALLENGYRPSSAYTLVKDGGGDDSAFRYRDHLWHGADMLGTGVASFGHLAGVHYQNLDKLEDYQAALAEGRLPLGRALPTRPIERLIREMILQTKLGRLDAGYFRAKFGVEILERFANRWDELKAEGYVVVNKDKISLTREGLLRVDSLLPRFFLPEHQTDRYT